MGNNLGEQFNIPDFVGANERVNIFVQTVNFQHKFTRCVGDGQRAASYRIPSFRAQGRDIYFVDLFCLIKYFGIIYGF